MDITIVIPVYNRRSYIRKTIESIPPAYPVILVDNGSTDGSYELCQNLAKTRQGDTFVVTEDTAGAAAARNKGLSLCQSKWIYFFDSDDVFTGLPASWDESCDLVCFPTRMLLDGKLHTRAYSPVTSPHTHILNSMLNTQGMIFSTSFLRDIGGWNEQCLAWDDWELGLRSLLLRPRLLWITQQAFHIILIHPDSITGSTLSSRADHILTALRTALDDIYRLQPSDQASLVALFYRCNILAGQMLCEKHPEARQKIHDFIADSFHVGRRQQLTGQLFEWGAARGMRGLWRMALLLADTYYKPT